MNKSSDVVDRGQEARASGRRYKVLDGGFLNSVGERLESDIMNSVPLGKITASVNSGTRPYVEIASAAFSYSDML